MHEQAPHITTLEEIQNITLTKKYLTPTIGSSYFFPMTTIEHEPAHAKTHAKVKIILAMTKWHVEYSHSLLYQKISSLLNAGYLESLSSFTFIIELIFCKANTSITMMLSSQFVRKTFIHKFEIIIISKFIYK